MDLKYFTNTSEKEAELLLYGDVGDCTFDGDIIAREIEFLNKAGYTKITERINSGGGGIVNGLSVVAANLNSKAEIVTIDDGIAASMAGVIFLTGDKRIINDFALLMLHEPSLFGVSLDEMPEGKDKTAMLAMNSQIVAIIKNNTAKSEEEIRAILSAETWYKGDEATKAGLADETKPNKRKPKINASMRIGAILNTVSNFNKTKKKMTLKSLTNHLQLNEDASENSILNKVKEIENSLVRSKKAEEKAIEAQLLAEDNLAKEKGNVTNLEASLKEANDKVTEIETAKKETDKTALNDYLNAQSEAGKIKKDAVEGLAITFENNLVGLKSVIEAFGTPHVDINNELNNMPAGTEKMTLREMEDKYPEKVEVMYKNNRAQYDKLYEAEYGKE